MRTLALAVALLITTGCATTPPSDYQRGMALATPATLNVNSRWALVLLDGHGQVAGSLVVRLTDAPVKTCDTGAYRRVEVLSDHRVDKSLPLFEPAYLVEGSALRIVLTTGVCDDSYAIIGGVTEAGFSGIHMPEVMIAPKNSRYIVRHAYGVPISE